MLQTAGDLPSEVRLPESENRGLMLRKVIHHMVTLLMLLALVVRAIWQVSDQDVDIPDRLATVFVRKFVCSVYHVFLMCSSCILQRDWQVSDEYGEWRKAKW